MRTDSYLDCDKVAREVESHTSWYSAEGEGRRYVRSGEQMAVTKGRYGVVMTMDEWKVFSKMDWKTLTKVLTPEVMETVRGLVEDYYDTKRMGVVFTGIKREEPKLSI